MKAECSLVVIDMQKFFFVENADVDQQRLADACGAIIELSASNGVPVVHVETLYRPDKLDWPKAWRPSSDSWCSNLVRGHELSRAVDPLVAKPDDIVVIKSRFSAFYNTNLDDILRSLGTAHVYIVGYSADVCLRYTAVDAYNRGYAVTLVYEGIESFREHKDASVEYLRWLIDANCVSVEEYQRAIEAT